MMEPLEIEFLTIHAVPVGPLLSKIDAANSAATRAALA